MAMDNRECGVKNGKPQIIYYELESVMDIKKNITKIQITIASPYSRAEFPQ